MPKISEAFPISKKKQRDILTPLMAIGWIIVMSLLTGSVGAGIWLFIIWGSGK